MRYLDSLALALMLCLAFANPAKAQDFFRIEKSSEIFFPPEARQLLFAQQEFPVFWWNFVIVPEASKNWSQVQALCQSLSSATDLVQRTACLQDLSPYQTLVSEWARDLFLREPKWNGDFSQARIKDSLAQASVIVGNPQLFQIILSDPLQTWRDLKAKADQSLRIPFEKKDGIFYDSKTDRAVLPILFSFPPSDSDRTRQVIGLLQGKAMLMGPHNAFFENESHIMEDVKVVSAVGSAVFLAFALFLIFSGRARAALLIPPVLLAIFLSTLITAMVFGSIHGLTLAFGSGIIGLALDYGLHAALGSDSKSTWSSNGLGLFTTLAGLIMLYFSSIPLLQQISVFSVLGLILGFAILYFLFRLFPGAFRIKAFHLPYGSHRLHVVTFSVLVLAAVVGLATVKPALDLHRFNFESETTKQNSQWLREEMKLYPPLMTFHQHKDYLERSQLEMELALTRDIRLENAAAYLPSLEEQKNRLASWESCPKLLKSPEEESLFGAYLSNCTEDRKVLDLLESVPSYLQHLRGSQYSLSLWLPQNQAQEAKIKAHFPQAKSLTEILLLLPQRLSQELKWMIPTALVLVVLMVLIYYRSLSGLLMTLLPFFTGLGLVFAMGFVFGKDVSFITVVGLVIVFGLSIDYGVFMASVYQKGLDQTHTKEVVSALYLAAITNLVGFAPMFFAAHPVLTDLAMALFFGTLGSLVGAVWGMPAMMVLLRRQT